MSDSVAPTASSGSDGAAPVGMEGGRRRRSGVSVKTLKKILKKNGLKTTGRKAALTRRAKKAHLKIRGGAGGEVIKGTAAMAGGAALTPHPVGQAGGRKKKSRSRGYKLF